jgi:hypothetical protein
MDYLLLANGHATHNLNERKREIKRQFYFIVLVMQKKNVLFVFIIKVITQFKWFHILLGGPFSNPDWLE